MKRTKRGAFALLLLLTLCVTLGLLPALTVTANAEGYSVTVDSMTNGTVTADKTSASAGETVTLTITPAEGCFLNRLTVKGKSTIRDQVFSDTADSRKGQSVTFTMPAANVTVSATFNQSTYNVNVRAAENGAVAAGASTAKMGDTVTLTVTGNNGYEAEKVTLTRKDGKGTVEASLAFVTGNKKTYNADMPASDVTVSATFKKISYPVEVQTVDGGKALIITGYDDYHDPITTQTATAQIGDTVTLEVVSDDGMQLAPPLALFAKTTPPEPSQTVASSWNATQSDGFYSFTITDSNIDYSVSKITVAPRFTPASPHNITVQDGIEHGGVTRGREKAPLYDTVRLTVTPNSGYVRDTVTVTPEGGGSVTPVQTSSSSTTEYWAFTMPNSNVTVNATFKKGEQRDINTNITGTGTVTVSAYGEENRTTAALNAIVTLKTAPAEGYELTELRVAPTDSASATEITLTEAEDGKQFVMPDEAVTVHATFKQIQPITPSDGDSATVAYGNTLEPVASVPSSNGASYEVTEGADFVDVDPASGKLTAKNVGTAVVRVTAKEDGAYAKATKDVAVTVTQRPLTVTANAQTKTYGDDDPALTYTVSYTGDEAAKGILDADAGKVLTGALAREDGTAAGEYAITQGTLKPNSEAGANYEITVYNSALLTITPPEPSYTIAAADTTTETDKKYQYGDEFTIAVKVSGADFEGGEFTLNYDSANLQVKTYPANNKFADSEQTAGSVKFEAQTKTTSTDGTALATIAFTVNAKVTTETTCNFTFEGTPKICYDTGENSVEAATVTPGSVIVEPVTYAVTLTGNNGVTFVKGGETITTDTAIDGQDYSVNIKDYSAVDYEYAVTLAVEGTQGTTTLTPSDTGVITVDKDNITGKLTVTVTRTTKHVTPTLEGATGSNDAIKGVDYTATIDDYDAANYAYTVTLTMNGASATAPTPDATGKLTIAGANITGDFTLTVTKTLANFTVTTTDDYVTGWTLVTVAKASGRTDDPVYNYDSKPMYYVEAYSAYAYLVSRVNGAVTVADAKAKVSLGTSAAGTIAAGYDVNNTGKVDYSDALLTYRCYEVVHETPATAMETYLRADVDASKKVDTTDVSKIDENRTPES